MRVNVNRARVRHEPKIKYKKDDHVHIILIAHFDACTEFRDNKKFQFRTNEASHIAAKKRTTNPSQARQCFKTSGLNEQRASSTSYYAKKENIQIYFPLSLFSLAPPTRRVVLVVRRHTQTEYIYIQRASGKFRFSSCCCSPLFLLYCWSHISSCICAHSTHASAYTMCRPASTWSIAVIESIRAAKQASVHKHELISRSWSWSESKASKQAKKRRKTHKIVMYECISHFHISQHRFASASLHALGVCSSWGGRERWWWWGKKEAWLCRAEKQLAHDIRMWAHAAILKKHIRSEWVWYWLRYQEDIRDVSSVRSDLAASSWCRDIF